MYKLSKTKLFYCFLALFFLLSLFFAIPVSAATKLDCKSVTLSPGHSIIVNLRNPVGPSLWSSSNSKVATVKFLEGFYDTETNEIVSRAKITARGTGTLKIKVENNKKTYCVKVRVKKNVKTKLTTVKKTMKVGKTFRLRLTNAVDPRINVLSYNEKIVQIDKNEKGHFEKGTEYVTVKGLKPGTTKIKVRDGKKTYVCKVKVVK